MACVYPATVWHSCNRCYTVTFEGVGEGVANMSHLQAGGGGMGGSLYLYFTPQNFLRVFLTMQRASERAAEGPSLLWVVEIPVRGYLPVYGPYRASERGL